MNIVIEQRPDRLPMSIACGALGLNRSSVYEWRKRAADGHPPPRRSRKESVQPRALSEQEREQVIETLHSAPYPVISHPVKSITDCSKEINTCVQ